MKARAKTKSSERDTANRPASPASGKARVFEKGNPRTGEGVGRRRIGGSNDSAATEKQNQ